MSRPFEGIKVLDATHILAGPYCGYQLALLGADTIKIEPPADTDPVRGRGPVAKLNAAGMGFNYLLQNGNKRAMTLDLKSAKGRDIFRHLATDADVVIENFRTGAFGKIGLGYEDIRAINPDVIYCSITAFGGSGPDAARTGYDPLIQGVSGVMHATGYGERGPLKAGAPFIDYASGLSAAFAVASALFHRERSGEGQQINVSMLDISLVMQGPAVVTEGYAGEKIKLPVEAGTDCYPTKAGYLQLGAYNFRQNKRLWNALGVPEFAVYTTWGEMWENAPRMRARLEQILPTRTADEWERLLVAAGVPAGRVRTLKEALATDHVQACEFMQALPDIDGVKGVRVPTAPFTFAHDGPALTRLPPRHGEHTEQILATAGYDTAAIARLRADGVI